MPRPVLTRWNGHAFEPAGDYHLRAAAEDYEDGQFYRLAIVDDVSTASRGYYHASIKAAFDNLPDAMRMEPWGQSPAHLRKYALIRSGWCHTVETVCATKADAMRTAAAMRRVDEYVLTVVADNVVRVYTPKSQRSRAMGKADFQQSKEDVLNFIAGLLGADPATLARQGEAA